MHLSDLVWGLLGEDVNKSVKLHAGYGGTCKGN